MLALVRNGWLSFLAVIFNLEIAVSKKEVLLAMFSRQSTHFVDLWTDPIYSSKTQQSWNDLYSLGYFRNPLIDEWTSDPPTFVDISTYDLYGGLMWYARLRTSDKGFGLHEWYLGNTVIASTALDLPSAPHMLFLHNKKTEDVLTIADSSFLMGWLHVMNVRNAGLKIWVNSNIFSQSTISPIEPVTYTENVIRMVHVLGNMYQTDLSQTKFLNSLQLISNESLSTVENAYIFAYAPYLCQKSCDWDFISLPMMSIFEKYNVGPFSARCLRVECITCPNKEYHINFTTVSGFVEANAIAIVGIYNISGKDEVSLETSLTETFFSCKTRTTYLPVHTTKQMHLTVMTRENAPMTAKPDASTIQNTQKHSMTQTKAFEDIASTSSKPTTSHSTVSFNSSELTTFSVISSHNPTDKLTPPETSAASGVCVCSCSHEFMSSQERETFIQNWSNSVKETLRLNETRLSSFFRKHHSIHDDRESAKSIGIVGVSIICSVVLFIVMLDVSSMGTMAEMSKK